MKTRIARRCLPMLILAGMSGSPNAETLTVRIAGPLDPAGVVGCSLFNSEQGFPMNGALAVASQWVPAQSGGVQCRFENLTPGNYAVSIMLDQNGNRRVDTNLVGMPQEPWGVSNNVRPSLRAPRWSEAVFTLAAGSDSTLDIMVRK